MTIKQKQNLLSYLGYYNGDIDGIWGELSRQATESFQRDFGITADGDPGPETQKAMKHAVAYGMPEREQVEIPSVSEKETVVGAGDGFWPRIRYFTKDEPGIACPCGKCGGFPVEPVERLMLNADSVREHFGKPMTPSSTVRCDSHNASLKESAANSLHKKGKAMDFGIPGVTAATIVGYVRTLPDVDECYAIDDSYVHMGVQKYG